jgi:hypothetical protein
MADASSGPGWRQASPGSWFPVRQLLINDIRPLAPLRDLRRQRHGHQQSHRRPSSTVLGALPLGTHISGREPTIGALPVGWKVADSWCKYSARSSYSYLRRCSPIGQLPSEEFSDDIRALTAESDRLQLLIEASWRRRRGLKAK